VSGAGLRILLAVDTAGSDWSYSLDLTRGLSRLGVETILASLGPSPSAAQRVAAASVPMLEMVETGLAPDVAEDGLALATAGRAIARLGQDAGVDLVQLNNAALAAEAEFDLPLVVAHHGCVATRWRALSGTDLPAEAAWRADQVRSGLAAADQVVTPTASFAALVQDCYRLAQPPRAVHIGRTPLAIAPAAQHDFVFTSGRLWDEGKNLATLDAAAAGLGVPVRAAGPLDGPDGPVMFDHIHCLGALGEQELGRWLAARPVFVSTALYEPFGLAVFEAAAAGCALILSDIPTFRELWDGVATFIPPRDEAGFTDAIAKLVGDDFERAVQGRATRERAHRYNPDAMAAQMAAIYRSLLPSVQRPVLAAARVAA
jgi:glycosyltransferase involved in cell wall biosynthesis